MMSSSGSGCGSTKLVLVLLESEEIVVIEMVVKVMIVVVARWHGGRERVPSDRGKKQRIRGMMMSMRMSRPFPPIYVQSMSIQIPKATLEGDNVTGIQLLLLHETAPPLSHHIALAAVPVGIPEPPHLPIPVLEIQEQTLLVG